MLFCIWRKASFTCYTIEIPEDLKDEFYFEETDESGLSMGKIRLLEHIAMIYGVDIDYKAIIKRNTSLTPDTCHSLEHRPAEMKLPSF